MVGVVVVVVVVFRRAMYVLVRDCCRWWYRLVVDMVEVVADVVVLRQAVIEIRCCL